MEGTYRYESLRRISVRFLMAMRKLELYDGLPAIATLDFIERSGRC